MQGFIYVPKELLSDNETMIIDHWECTGCKKAFVTENPLTGAFEPPQEHQCGKPGRTVLPVPRKDEVLDEEGEPAAPEPAYERIELLCQRWEESESGWGTRPDGYSLHTSREAHRAYLDAVYKDRTGPAPDSYERVDGQPYWCVVNAKDLPSIQPNSGTWRIWNNKYPERK